MKHYVSDIDRIMALIYEDQPLPPPVLKKPVPKRLPEKRKPRLQLDFGSLERIRSDAEVTMNKLITDEEREETVFPEPEAAVFPESGPEPVCGLDPVETQVLLKLLESGDVSGVDTAGRMLSVLIDQINEKLFDEFADTVIENGSRPQIVPDYETDLKEMFLQVIR